MTKQQTTVLGLLLAAAGLHIWLDPVAKSNFKQFLQITPDNWRQLGANTISGYMLYALSLAAMLLLAEYLPTLATWIAVIILTGAVLINNGAITQFLQQAEQALQPIATSNTNKPN